MGNCSRKYKAWSDVYNEIWVTPSYLDTREFKEYAAAIGEIIQAAKSSVSIRDIHRKLGDKVRIEWTADALEYVNNIVAIGILPTRYRTSTCVKSPRKVSSKKANSMRWMFPNRPHLADE